MKRIRKIVALAMVMIISLVYPVSAAELNAESQEMEGRSVNYYTGNYRFRGSFNRYVDGSGQTTTYLDTGFFVGYNYEEGVYSSIVSATHLGKDTAIHNGISSTPNYYVSSSRVHNGRICGVYGINGVMYRAHMKLDEWGDPVMERLGYLYDFCIT